MGEDIILKATELGINTCWVTFESSNVVKDRLAISTGKELTAIIAMGYNDAEGKKKVINPTKTGENYSKSNMEVVPLKNSSTRLSVEEIVYIGEWGKNAGLEELKNRGLFDAFHYAGLAPSTLNRQPWRFIVDDGQVILAVRDDEHTNTYEERIDAGIVMHHFGAIVDETLFKLNWKLEKPSKDYKIPSDYVVVGYCNI